MHSLDEILAMAELRAEEAKRPELRKQRITQIFADIAKYEKIVANQHAQGLISVAWDALVAAYPETLGVDSYDVDAFLAHLGIAPMTYTDPRTGLMWVIDGNIASKTMNWGLAMFWVKKLNFRGYRDWRLPTKIEFEYFVKQGGDNPTSWFNANGFNNVQPTYYWTSDTDPDNSTTTNGDKGKSAYFVNMFNTSLSSYIDVNHNFYVWPVRGES